MIVLVTGCAGFIGWKVTELLLRDGQQVVGIDNLEPAYDVRLKQWRLARLQENQRFTFEQLDIANADSLKKLSPQLRLDAVINLAAKAGVRRSVAEPGAYITTNLIGTLNLLDLCRKRSVQKFVLASTSSVYGDGERPFKEGQNTDRPRSPYAASKKAAELLAYAYHSLHGVDVSIPRYFTVYGPAGRPDMSVFRFIRWLAEGEPLVVYGSGEQERDFTYVDDIARGTLAALKPLGFEVINLGTDSPVRLLSMIEMLERLLRTKARLDKRPGHAADAQATAADISKARALLGWQPQTTLADGLAKAVEWYLENREWARQLSLAEGSM